MEPKPEAISAIKLTRADAVKLVAAEMIEQCAGDVERCEAAVIECRDGFHSAVVARARDKHYRLLSDVLEAVGSKADALHGACGYRVYEEDDDGPTAQVVFADHPQTYEARFRIAVSIRLSATELKMARTWQLALVALRAARERDLRVGAMKKEARDKLIKSALSGTLEGAAVVASVTALAKALREKV
jgi:hypothetical protein